MRVIPIADTGNRYHTVVLLIPSIPMRKLARPCRPTRPGDCIHVLY